MKIVANSIALISICLSCQRTHSIVSIDIATNAIITTVETVHMKRVLTVGHASNVLIEIERFPVPSLNSIGLSSTTSTTSTIHGKVAPTAVGIALHLPDIIVTVKLAITSYLCAGVVTGRTLANDETSHIDNISCLCIKSSLSNVGLRDKNPLRQCTFIAL